MEFVIVLAALVALDILAMRFGADSRNLKKRDDQDLVRQRAQI